MMAEQEEEEVLSLRRSRRSTAGNRMEEALLQFAMEEQNQEPEEDADFVGPEDEVEIFDSDFQSTDDEAQQEDEGAGERAINEEEKREQRTLRQRAAKVVTAAITRQRVGVKESRPKPTKLKNRRVSLGGAVDAETGEAVDTRANRKSRRKSTVLAAQILRNRLKDAEVKKALMPKRVKEVTQLLSQAELIARALDNEESNIDEHRNYLAQEEEKRKRARVVRKSITGPLIRWTSRVEKEKVPVEPSSHSIFGHTASSSSASNQASTSVLHDAPRPNAHPNTSVFQIQTSTPLHLAPPAPERTETVSKNYIVIEKDQKEGASMPKWDETMTTLFGDHVKWDEVKVFSGKHRPLSRPIARCPLTGRPASYRDPRSGVPFANVRAYRTLTRLLNHEYAWHDGLGCYTADTAYMDLT